MAAFKSNYILLFNNSNMTQNLAGDVQKSTFPYLYNRTTYKWVWVEMQHYAQTLPSLEMPKTTMWNIVANKSAK